MNREVRKLRNRIHEAVRRVPVVAMVVSMALLVAACGGKQTVKQDFPMPVLDPAPVAIGVYYTDTLRNHKCTGGKGYIAYEWTFELGPPSIAMYDNLLGAMFENTSTVSAKPGAGQARGNEDVIEIHMTEFTGCDASWPVFGASVDIHYEAILWSAEGKELTRWNARGTAGPADPYVDYMDSGGEAEYLAALTKIAMRKAATDFVLNYENDPVVKSRLLARSQ